MIIVTRPGNPAGIKSFADLAQPGLNLVHAEPGRSGAGDWTVLAEYGSAYLAASDSKAAEEQLRGIWKNVKVMGSSAKATLTLFELGADDALVTYEQEALLAADRGAQIEIVLPESTIVAEHVAVVVDANVTNPEKRAAEDFIDFLLCDDGQSILAENHMRPPRVEADALAGIPRPFTIEDLGGWSSSYQSLIEGLWKGQIAPQLASNPLSTLVNGQD
jgi:sulfate transport system substrate-binding protein